MYQFLNLTQILFAALMKAFDFYQGPETCFHNMSINPHHSLCQIQLVISEILHRKSFSINNRKFNLQSQVGFQVAKDKSVLPTLPLSSQHALWICAHCITRRI
jgi:hypothetical protein